MFFLVFDFSCPLTSPFTVSDTSVAGTALRAHMKTGAGAFVCFARLHAQTAGITHVALPASPATS